MREVTSQKQSSCTVSSEAITNAIIWLFSEKHFKSTAYGTRSEKINDGTLITLPTYYRNRRISELYSIYCATQIMPRLPKKLFYQLVKIIGPKKDKQLAELDSCSMNLGYENFIAFEELAKLLMDNELEKELENIQNYLKHDFRNHLSEENCCNGGNYSYLFKEKDNQLFCLCQRCRDLADVSHKIMEHINRFPCDQIPDSKEDLK